MPDGEGLTPAFPHPLEQHGFKHIKGVDPIPLCLGSAVDITIIAATEPTLENDTFALWKDTTNTKYYLIWKCGTTQKKVELI